MVGRRYCLHRGAPSGLALSRLTVLGIPLAALGSVYEVDAELSTGDTAILQSLMNAGHADRVEFMG